MVDFSCILSILLLHPYEANIQIIGQLHNENRWSETQNSTCYQLLSQESIVEREIWRLLIKIEIKEMAFI